MVRQLFVLLLLLGLAGGAGRSAAAEEPEEAGRPGVPDAALQEAINQAIDRGAAWLRGQQKFSGMIGAITTRSGTFYDIGTSALAGLALLAAGDQRGDEAVDRIMAFCRAQDDVRGGAGSRTTYDTGVLLMFITAYYRPPQEAPGGDGHTVTGRHSKNPCEMPDAVQRWVQDLVNWLVRVRQEPSTWGYPDHRDDLSNTQYAYLGLRAARDCGAKVPSIVFLKGIETLLARQEQDGPKIPRIIPGAGPSDSPYAVNAGDRARGWSYLSQPFLATGSMTTAGIAVLAICHDALVRPKRVEAYTSQQERAVKQAVQDGFSWLDLHWAVDKNPPDGAPAWHYYYLYGLERAAVLGGRDLIGEHDWYLDGARYLVSHQAADGRWSTRTFGGENGEYEASDVVDTAWAILFLARATRPAPPLRPPVVTEGD
jgi:hypothetical protein